MSTKHYKTQTILNISSGTNTSSTTPIADVDTVAEEVIVPNLKSRILCGSSKLKRVKVLSAQNDISYCFYGCTSLEEVLSIPSNVINLDRAFYECAALKDFDIDFSNVTNLAYAFYGCSQLKRFTKELPNVSSLTGTFANSGLEEITTDLSHINNFDSAFMRTLLTEIPASIQNTVGANFSQTFANTKITSATLPNNASSYSYCFSNCKELLEFVFRPVQSSTKVSMMGMFEGCEKLRVVPNNLFLNASSNLSYVFEGCATLMTSPEIPEGVEDLMYAFADSALYVAPIIPSTVVSMNETFANTQIFDCKILATTPPTVTAHTFPSSCTRILVPSSALASYQADEDWINCGFVDRLVGF